MKTKIEAKEKNIIIFGLEESKKEKIEEKKEEDLLKLGELMKVMKVSNSPQIDTIFRINSKDTSKPKPTIIVLKSVDDRNKILKCTKNLNDTQ